MPRAAVAKVVAIDARDHDVRELHRGDGLGEMAGLVRVERLRPPVRHVAERAAARAEVAHDHEGRRAAAEALADVRARGLLAHGVELRLAQYPFHFRETLAAPRAHADPFGLAQRRPRGRDL